MVIDGNRPINFSVVGCDYPYYQPWLRNSINGQEQQLMEKAIKESLNRQSI
jgi:hypothetical protein